MQVVCSLASEPLKLGYTKPAWALDRGVGQAGVGTYNVARPLSFVFLEMQVI